MWGDAGGEPVRSASDAAWAPGGNLLTKVTRLGVLDLGSSKLPAEAADVHLDGVDGLHHIIVVGGTGIDHEFPVEMDARMGEVTHRVTCED